MARRRLLPVGVRGRITTLATMAVTAALVVGAALLVTAFTSSLTRSEDAQARIRVADLAEAVRLHDLPRVVAGIGDNSLAQVVSGEGRVLASSANIVGRPGITGFVPAGTRPEVRTMRDLPDDQETEDYRVWAARVSRTPGAAVVYVGQSLEASQEAAVRLVRSLAIGLPLLVAILAGVIWTVVGRTLRPVEAIRREVDAVRAGDLDRRVSVPPTGDEIARLAVTMNAMLERLQRADSRQREFVGNASHDLQSPLTAFRAELEVALAHPDRTDWVATAASLLEESDRMESLVRDLLFLARAESGDPGSTVRPVDLDDVVREEVSRLRPPEGIEVRSVIDAAPVNGSREDLARLVRNLLANACTHASRVVDVRLASDQARAVLTVHDDGPGVAPQDRARIFDRFYRAAPARDRDSAGTGLGLAIVRSVADAHGGEAHLDETDAGASFVVSIPVLQ